MSFPSEGCVMTGEEMQGMPQGLEYALGDQSFV